MTMLLVVRLECDRCLSHRDINIGDAEDSQIAKGVVMLVLWRAAEIGWRISTNNAQKSCLCERCKDK
jgi:hypothetical protein